MFLLEKDYNEFELHYNKQSVEEILIRRAVKTTIQKLYKGLFDDNGNAKELLEDFSLVARKSPELEQNK